MDAVLDNTRKWAELSAFHRTNDKAEWSIVAIQGGVDN